MHRGITIKVLSSFPSLFFTSGIRALRSMAPTVPTVNQRVEELEDAMGNMEARLTEMVSQAVEKGLGALKHSLVDMMLAS